MAISLSQSIIERKKQSIADRLAGQTEKLQEQPWWKTVGSIALPLLATAAMGPLGGYLSSLTGAAGGLGGLLGGVKGGATIAKALGMVGKGLGAAKKGQGLLSTLGGVTTKALYNIGTQKAGKGLLESFDKRSAQDISAGDDPLSQLLGGRAQEKIRGQYRRAKDAEKTTNITGSILTALAQQGGGELMETFKDAFGVTFGAPSAEQWLSKINKPPMVPGQPNMAPYLPQVSNVPPQGFYPYGIGGDISNILGGGDDRSILDIMSLIQNKQI